MPFWDRRRPQPADESTIAAFARACPPSTHDTGDRRWTERDTRNLLGNDHPTFTAFVARHAGDTFFGGALRFLSTRGDLGLVAWNSKEGWRHDWPSVPASVAFATDWRGNLFLLGPSRFPDGERSLAVLEIATGDYVSLDLPFAGYLNMLTHQSQRDLLDLDTLDAWVAAGGATPGAEQCLGHRRPLVIGGATDVSNLELLSLRVWVSMSGQLFEQTKNLPPGYQITGFKLVK